ncbi:competence protein ComFB [Alkalispirochaeta americana]|uniref:Competence protein ComFB n=1 Tax=Alkalispirochaeta americana TaxID=159291 RepID=A0A1N6PSL7_9SPIO|nr:late competence development ComFB family protein [Alkalispirochaeta americana]SIQ07303.1 competence protein ComFB [Alkalispirochaeta americana]
MDFRDLYAFDELANEAERLVIDELERQLEGENAPDLGEDADGIVLDIAAYALNRVPPLYRANLLGRLYADSLKDEHEKTVREAVADAIAKVIG